MLIFTTVLSYETARSYKKGKTTNTVFSLPFLWLDPGSGIRDGKKSGSGIRYKHPGSATLYYFYSN
jgi:hypothetical protein